MPGRQERLLTHSEMMQAVHNRDANFDGRFFTCVRTTGIFCFPSCPARKPKPESVLFVSSREEALRLGFRPCKRCHSDLAGGQREYERNLVRGIAQRVDQSLGTVQSAELAAATGFSLSHLNRILRRNVDMSLDQLIRQRRVERAARMLQQTDRPVLEIALAVGFSSLSAFYTVFQRHFRQAPGSYRQRIKEEVNVE